MRSSSIVLLSGGLDSLAAFCWAHQETDLMFGLTINYGQRAAPCEARSSAVICRHYDVKHVVTELPWYAMLKTSPLVDPASPLPEMAPGDLDNPEVTRHSAQAVWVPNRNGVFVNVAASFAESWLANLVVTGFNCEEAETFPDNSEAFVESANNFFGFSTQGRVRLVSPMSKKTKKEIVLWALENKLDLSPIWSCYRGGDAMCGVCESCLRLRRALKEAGSGKWLKKLFP